MQDVGLDLDSDEMQQDDHPTTMLEDEENSPVPAIAQQADEAMVDLQNDSNQGSDNMSIDSADSTISREERLYMKEVTDGTFFVEGKSISEYRQMVIEARIASVRLENTYRLQRKVDLDLVNWFDSILYQISKPATYGLDNWERYEHAAVLKREFEGWLDYWDAPFSEIQSSIIDEEGHCEGYVEPQREWIDVSTMEISVEKSSEGLTMGIGAIVSFPVKCIHPKKTRNDAFPQRKRGQRIENCRVVRKQLCQEKNKNEVMCIVVNHPGFSDRNGNLIEFYVREERVRIDREGDPKMFFHE